MPLRDHFRPPAIKYATWEGFHALWPAAMVYQLVRKLPPGFVVEPRVHLGTFFELDISAYEHDDVPAPEPTAANGDGGVATAVSVAARPTLTLETDLPDQYAYEVRIFDAERDRRLVAAVEIVSPGNKDRPESRRAFVAKTAALLQQGVCVSMVDLVTVRHFNLYADLLALIDRTDPALGAEPPATYAATCRGRTGDHRPLLDVWYAPLVVGQPLPGLPLWLTDDIGVTLDLEASYEETCRTLRIP
ncbi:MAG: DUF4058 family protein [Gemmataceae bacterium]